MNEKMDEKIDEKIYVVLNLIRTNNTSDEALKISQAFVNMTLGKNNLALGDVTPKKQRAGA